MARSRTRPVDSFRQRTLEHFESEIGRAAASQAAAGRWPFEGAWRSADEILSLRAEMKRRDRRILLELLALFVLFAGLIGFVAVLLIFVLPH